MFKGFFFEYFYYKLYHRNKEEGPFRGFQAVCIIAAIQTVALVDLQILLQLFFDLYPFKNSSLVGYMGGFSTLAFAIYNFKRYNKKIDDFDSRWDVESQDDRLIKGTLMVLTAIVLLIPLILITKF